MPLYFTKKDLYTAVDNIRKAHRVPITDVSVCIRDFLDHYIPVEVKTLPFLRVDIYAASSLLVSVMRVTLFF